MSLTAAEIVDINKTNATRQNAAKKAATARRRCKHKADVVTSKAQDDGKSKTETCSGCDSIRVVSLDGSEVYASWYWR